LSISPHSDSFQGLFLPSLSFWRNSACCEFEQFANSAVKIVLDEKTRSLPSINFAQENLTNHLYFLSISQLTVANLAEVVDSPNIRQYNAGPSSM
jgi:hypothetical protein